jgi:hypothetical protein
VCPRAVFLSDRSLPVEVSRQPAAGVALRVRGILHTRNLDIAEVARETHARFPNDSQYHVPHNFYFQLRSTGLSPTLHQVMALSQLSNYRFSDWLAIFGFRLDEISRLQAIIPRSRTALLDPTVYDDQAQIPWFGDRTQPSALPPVAPLSQVLETVGVTSLASLLALSHDGYRYARIGQHDAFAFPDLLPGSIVRVNPQVVDRLLPTSNGELSRHFFLVEHSRGLCCCRLHLGAKNRITLASSELPFAQVELQVGREARILGVLDLELRPATNLTEPDVPPDLTKHWKPAPLVVLRNHARLSTLLRNARFRAGLSLREASAISRRVAHALRDPRYYASSGALSDYEASDSPPRHIHKLLTLSILYSIHFPELVKTIGLQWSGAAGDSIPEVWRMHNSQKEGRQQDLAVPNGSQFFSALLGQFGEIPFFLHNAFPSLSGLDRVSLRDVFWVREPPPALHPSLIGSFLVIVDHRKKKPFAFHRKPVWEQPLYLLQKRDASYLLASCTLEDHTLVVRTSSEGFVRPERFRNRVEAEVVGQIVAIARSLIPPQ